MTDAERREAARQFSIRWNKQGKEDEQDQKFWNEFLESVMGVSEPYKHMDFQKKVYVDGNWKRIDAYIPETRVLIEQKSLGVDLSKPQAGHGGKTPFEQAKEYDNALPVSEKARWIVVSNFSEFWIYDMDQAKLEPIKINLEDLQSRYSQFDFLVSKEIKKISQEMEISLKAGEIVGLLYDGFRAQYKNPDDSESLKSLNKLCVRIVFCLYAEDAGIFHKKNLFHDYMAKWPAKEARRALVELFKVLDQKPEERDPYLADDRPLLAQFPYVNGGLFADENIEIPPLTDDLLYLITEKASADFDWSGISPTIFGAVFESTLNPETRRSGGMHYTSIENIHKVIDPLFLDDLKLELAEIKSIDIARTKKPKLETFQNKLAGLKFLDPACGSGNFCTESYLSIRRLENETIRMLLDLEKGAMEGQIVFGAIKDPIKVDISQFYGIEINDFAVTVAKTALWIAESQMMQETEDMIHANLDFLPLKTNANIVEGNALRIDWNDICPANELNYIMGNPPFIGNSRLTNDQKEERDMLFDERSGELDYVCCWYKKAAKYITNTCINCAFVSTNSICQGQQVSPLWKSLFNEGIKIDFAYKTFIWDSEATIKAHVYCVIIGFSKCINNKDKLLYENSNCTYVEHINGYLLPIDDVFIDKRTTPLFDNIPRVIKGFQPTDNGYLILDEDEKEIFLKQEPTAEKWIRPFITAREFLHRKNRWCLWLVGASPAEINSMPKVKQRVVACKEWREHQKKTGDAYKLKDIPALMRQNSKFMESDFIVMPRVSGERRRYIPFGFIEKGAIPGDSIMLATGVNHYHFGILCSNVHMAWTRTVCGRLKGDYRYSSDIVYNNFPWPLSTEEQKQKIEQTAQEILDVRALYPDCSYDELYDPNLMPPELRKAHTENDKAVMKAYGFDLKMSEAECVAELMKMYQKLTENK